VDATDIAMLVAGEFAQLKDSARVERYRIEPPIRELLRDQAGIPFEAWTCLFNPATRGGIAFDSQRRRFVLVEDGVAEGSYASLKSMLEDGRAF
jgi:hypothetical protein